GSRRSRRPGTGTSSSSTSATARCRGRRAARCRGWRRSPPRPTSAPPSSGPERRSTTPSTRCSSPTPARRWSPAVVAPSPASSRSRRSWTRSARCAPARATTSPTPRSAPTRAATTAPATRWRRMAEALAEPTAADSALRPWRPLLVQVAALLAAGAALVIWLVTADLTAVERETLNPDSLLQLLGQHLWLTAVSTVIVLAIAVPLGVLLTRGPMRRAAGPVLAVANFGQAAPAVGLIVLIAAAPFLPNGFWAAIIALVLYAALPVLG